MNLHHGFHQIVIKCSRKPILGAIDRFRKRSNFRIFSADAYQH